MKLSLPHVDSKLTNMDEFPGNYYGGRDYLIVIGGKSFALYSSQVRDKTNERVNIILLEEERRKNKPRRFYLGTFTGSHPRQCEMNSEEQVRYYDQTREIIKRENRVTKRRIESKIRRIFTELGVLE